MSIITISHEAFGDGRAVAERVAAILGYPCMSREVLVKASQRYGIAEDEALRSTGRKAASAGGSNGSRAAGFIAIVLQAALCELAQDGNIVYHGRAGQEFFPGIRHVFNVFVDTPRESRIRQVWCARGSLVRTQKNTSKNLDRIRARRIRELFKIDWRDPTRYDLVLNTAKITVETAAQLIAEVSQREEYQPDRRSPCRP